ncbi:MAG: CBS domain-containing protein [Thiobacillus sp.]|nr:CBS domain-containing protein [Thiobacillus sp.]
MYIRDVLTIKGDLQTLGIAPDAPVADAVAQLVAHDIGSLVVMRGETMVGFITERDILRGMQTRDCRVEGVKVSDLMEKEPIVAASDDTVDYARDVMTKHRISHLIVMDQDRLTGVISFHDVAKACLKDANFQNSLLKRYIKHWPE